MSLVAYGSSDESENEEEEYVEQPQVEIKSSVATVNLQLTSSKNDDVNSIEKKQTVQNVTVNNKLNLPTPKIEVTRNSCTDNIIDSDEELAPKFDALPKPRNIVVDKIKEADNLPIPKKIDYDGVIVKPPKKEKGPAKISIPSLSEFKDSDDEEEYSSKIKASKKGSGLIGMLPQPKSSMTLTKTTTTRMIPNALRSKPVVSKPMIPQSVNKTFVQKPMISQSKPSATLTKPLSTYNSDSEDDDDKGSSTTDFFSLSTPLKIPDYQLPISSTDVIDTVTESSSTLGQTDDNVSSEAENTNKILRNNVMDISKEEIILKNKAEVGPKLPVPEQEYHLDSDGNVALDERAMEYLCGKRGVKRKNEFENIDVVEISGDDIKPDEREWLVKALTEEQAQRPLSVSSGPGGQSKKKHQITYLAHQAKAMEIELKNQWATSKANRQQSRSKYGF